MKAIHTTENFDGWFAGLRDKQVARRIQARIDRAEDGNFGDCEPEDYDSDGATVEDDYGDEYHPEEWEKDTVKHAAR